MSNLEKQRRPRFSFRDNFPPLSKEHAAALGQVVVSWSVVEDYCATIIGFLFDADGEVRHALTSEMPFQQRLHIIGALVHCTRDQELLDHWHELAALVDTLRNERNDVIHGE